MSIVQHFRLVLFHLSPHFLETPLMRVCYFLRGWVCGEHLIAVVKDVRDKVDLAVSLLLYPELALKDVKALAVNLLRSLQIHVLRVDWS